MSDELHDRIATRLGHTFMEAAKAMREEQVHKVWMKDDFSEQGDIGYFFHRNYSGAASITLSDDGSLVFEGHNHKVVIKNIGSRDEKVSVKFSVTGDFTETIVA